MLVGYDNMKTTLAYGIGSGGVYRKGQIGQPSSTPLDPISETPPTIKYQVATPSQPQYKIEDGGINRFQFLVQYSSSGVPKILCRVPLVRHPCSRT
ncbi:hypothetical protein TNCV_1644311 [Trichonephila clavipes]|nr:hypothetical protein TNCV_1644311 [Trichonephila clavipes]